jgi:phosphatidylglycerophosphatase A
MLASGVFLGYSPWVSGTVGTLWGLPICFILSGQDIRTQGGILVIAILAAIFVSERASRIWAEKDPSRVVADEIVGYMTAMVALPFSWRLAGVGFILFRILDIVKPFPVRQIDRTWPGGWGIVLDDVLAGAYTHMLLRAALALKVL